MYHPHLEILNAAFYTRIWANTALDKLWTGARWLEGPVTFVGGRYVLFSDIPNQRILRFDETTDAVSVFRQPSNFTNGNTRDAQGRLISCEHLTRRVTRTEHDGRIVVLADRYNGKRLNSPNDVVVHADGSVWFTDPTYGIDADYEGRRAPEEIGGSYVYRIDAESGEIDAVITDLVRPNGLAFSPDYKLLYVSDTGVSHVPKGPRDLYRYHVVDNRRVEKAGKFATCESGVFDGFRLDEDGFLWSSAGDGVHCFDPDGTLIGKIRVPEVVANVAWGGPARNRLYICGTTSLYAQYLSVRGMPYPGDGPVE